jgi:hypothetical protein
MEGPKSSYLIYKFSSSVSASVRPTTVWIFVLGHFTSLAAALPKACLFSLSLGLNKSQVRNNGG